VTEDHKKNRIGAPLIHLLRFNDHGEDFLEQIITGDETLVHQYCLESKTQSMAWMHSFKASTSNGQLMATVFWDRHGVLMLHFSPPNEIVNSAAYQVNLKNLRQMFNARGLRCQARGCCWCMTKPDRIQHMRQ
jgi:hypothetical protein